MLMWSGAASKAFWEIFTGSPAAPFAKSSGLAFWKRLTFFEIKEAIDVGRLLLPHSHAVDPLLHQPAAG